MDEEEFHKDASYAAKVNIDSVICNFSQHSEHQYTMKRDECKQVLPEPPTCKDEVEDLMPKNHEVA